MSINNTTPSVTTRYDMELSVEAYVKTMYGVMIKLCHCHGINVRNYTTMQTLYDINGWVYLQYLFRNPAFLLSSKYRIR